MAPTELVERSEPTVIPRVRASVRSRLHPILRVAILIVLNLGFNSALWSFVSNFLTPELGAVSKVPNDADLLSLYSPVARLATKTGTVWMTWYFNYDFYDVTALTVLTNAPYAYLLSTFYEISTLTVAAYVSIEVLSIALPTYLLRPRLGRHDRSTKLRNRFLLNSAQTQLSGTFLATGVYITVIWAGLKTGSLNSFLVQHFDIPTFELAHVETPLSILCKTLTSGMAVKEFLFNSSIAAQPPSGAVTPVEPYEPATATLPQTIRQNVWYFGKRTRTLVQQTAILNLFVFANTVQKTLTLNGADFEGAAGYASLWIAANAIVALWFGWVGDTSPDYEPL